MHWLHLAIAIVAEVIATSALKAAAGFYPAPALPGGGGRLRPRLLLSLPDPPGHSMGVAYAVWSAVGIALVSLIGWLVYDQRLDAPALLGMGLIVAGVAVIQLFSRTAH